MTDDADDDGVSDEDRVFDDEGISDEDRVFADEGISDEDRVFDEEQVRQIARTHAVDSDRLRAVVDEHQATVRSLPGPENLVYEWRRRFDATVLERTERAYYVDAPPWVWEEFGEHLGATDAEVAALAAVHARTLESQVGDVPDPGDGALVVLERTG